MRTLLSIVSVIAGFAVVLILSAAMDAIMHGTGIFPPEGVAMSGALFLWATAYRCAFQVLGGYVTARIAPGRPMVHGWVLGCLGVLGAIGGVIYSWDKGPEFGPKWYPILLVVLALPTVLWGARLGARKELSNA